jgi:hypothetical protein
MSLYEPQDFLCTSSDIAKVSLSVCLLNTLYTVRVCISYVVFPNSKQHPKL